MHTLGGESPLSQKSKILASSPNGRAKGGTLREAFSLRRRWPAHGGSDVVSAPPGACPQDNRGADCHSRFASSQRQHNWNAHRTWHALAGGPAAPTVWGNPYRSSDTERAKGSGDTHRT